MQTIAALRALVNTVGEAKVDFSLATRVSPATLRKIVPNADVWHVPSPAARAITGPMLNRDEIPTALITLAAHLMERFENAAAKGIATLVIDEPTMNEFFLPELAKRLGTMGFNASVERVSRHRFCPHTNGKGVKCDHGRSFDSGAGDINPLCLIVSIPPAT